ncbi:MAG: hypothetical protein ACRCX2_39175 [Paraclostridium sp.]
MARRNKGSKDYQDLIQGFISDIMNTVDFDKETKERIKEKKDNMSVLLKSSKSSWDTADAYVIGEFFKSLIEEVIFAECPDSLVYKEIAQEIVDMDIDERESTRERSSRDNSTRKGGKDAEVFFGKFKAYLNANDLSPRPTYTNFMRLVDKFKLKKIATFPNVETMEELYTQWENFIGK